MKLIFKQRMFSWLAGYDIFNEMEEAVYTVKGKLAWGQCFRIMDACGQEIGMVKRRLIGWQAVFDIYRGGEPVGSIRKEITFFKPQFHIDYRGWQVHGNWMERDYTICDEQERTVATIRKAMWKLTDTYAVEVQDAQDALDVVLLVLAIDAEKGSRD